MRSLLLWFSFYKKINYGTGQTNNFSKSMLFANDGRVEPRGSCHKEKWCRVPTQLQISPDSPALAPMEHGLSPHSRMGETLQVSWLPFVLTARKLRGFSCLQFLLIFLAFIIWLLFMCPCLFDSIISVSCIIQTPQKFFGGQWSIDHNKKSKIAKLLRVCVFLHIRSGKTKPKE